MSTFLVIVSGVGPQRETDEMIGNATTINRAELVEKLSGTLGDTLAGEAGVSTTFFGQGASRPVLRGPAGCARLPGSFAPAAVREVLR